MKLSRVLAYLFDIFIVTLLSTLIFALPIFKESYQHYTEYSTEQMNILIKEGSSISDEKLMELEYNISVAALPLYIIRLGVLFGYFGIIAFILKGQTLGKKIFGLKVVDVIHNDLNVNLFMFRSILVSNLIPNLLTVLVLILCKDDTWITLSGIISFIQTIMTILMLSFFLTRSDGRGLHDLICHTAVISSKDEKK